MASRACLCAAVSSLMASSLRPSRLAHETQGHQRVGLHPGRVGGAGGGDPALGPVPGHAEILLHHQGIGVGSEGPRVLPRRRVRGGGLDRGPGDLGGLGGGLGIVDQHEVEGEALADPAGQLDVYRGALLGLGGDELPQPPEQVHGALHVAAVRRVGRGQQAQLAAGHARRLLRLGHPLPQGERLVVVAVRLGRGAQLLGILPGPDGRGERAGNVMAGQAVLGQFRRGARHREPLLVGEQRAHRGVQPGPLPGQQVRVDGFAEQGVPEDIAFGAVGHEQLVGDRLPHRSLVFGGRQARCGPHQLVVGLAAGHGRGAEHLLGGVGQLLDPVEQQGRQPGGQDAVLAGIAADRGGEQFLGVIGVALGPGHDVIQLGRVDADGRGGGEVLGQGGGIQWGEVDRDDAGQPQQLGHHGPERVTPVQIVGPVAADQGDPLPVQHPGQERDQVPGGGVGPVQVLQHEQDRRRGRQLGEQAEHAAEHLLPGQARAVRVGDRPLAALRQQPAQGRARAERVADPGGLGGAAERVGQRQVGHAVAQLGALPGQHGKAPAGGQPGDLADQAGLAHPGIAADQRDHRPARLGVVEEVEQAAELAVAPDHTPS